MSGIVTTKQTEFGVILTLVNPTQRNALTPQMLLELEAAINSVSEYNANGAIFIRGADGIFSSGYAMDRFPKPEELNLDDEIERACAAIENARMPVVAVVEGYCVGAALEVACACDLRFGTADTRLGITPAKMGLVYSLRGTRRIYNAAGTSATRYLFYTGDLVRCDSDIGRNFVSTVFANSEELFRGMECFGATIAARAPLAVAGARQIFQRIDATTQVSRSLEEEILKLRRHALRSADVAEALVAFGDRREPHFEGR